VTGLVTIEPGKVTLKDVSAIHGDAQIKTEASAAQTPAGNGRFQLARRMLVTTI